MPTLNAATTVQFTVWDTAANAGKTGDAANLTLRRVINTTASTITATPVEVDATNCPGLYAVVLTGAENSGAIMSVGGKSSTASCSVIPTTWANESIWAATTRSLTDKADFALSTASQAAIVTALLQGDCTAYEATGATGVRVADMLTAIRAVVLGKLSIVGTTATYYEVDGTTVAIELKNVAADYSSHDGPTGAP